MRHLTEAISNLGFWLFMAFVLWSFGWDTTTLENGTVIRTERFGRHTQILLVTGPNAEWVTVREPK